jgi:hypothetical protein
MAEGASLKPSEMTEGSGLLDDVTCTWKSCSFEMFDYQGKSPQPVPALKAVLDPDDSGDETDQYWSMGNAKDWIPSDDGKRLVAVGSATTLKTSSNGAILLTSLVNAGFPEDKIGDDISVFEGMVAHMVRIPAPKRPGLKKRVREDGREFEDTVLTVGEIISLPWEKKKAKGAPKGKAAAKGAPKKAAAKPAADAGADDDVNDAAVAFMMGALAEAGDDGLTKKELPTMAFQALKDDPNRNAIVQLVYQDDFLANGPWNYEDGVVSM